MASVMDEYEHGTFMVVQNGQARLFPFPKRYLRWIVPMPNGRCRWFTFDRDNSEPNILNVDEVLASNVVPIAAIAHGECREDELP